MSPHGYAQCVDAVCSNQRIADGAQGLRSIARKMREATRKVRAVPLPSEEPETAETWLSAQDAQLDAWNRVLSGIRSGRKLDKSEVARLEETTSRTNELAREVGANVCVATGWTVYSSDDTIALLSGGARSCHSDTQTRSGPGPPISERAGDQP
jgi:hypothetical protein